MRLSNNRYHYKSQLKTDYYKIHILNRHTGSYFMAIHSRKLKRINFLICCITRFIYKRLFDDYFMLQMLAFVIEYL